MSKLIAKIVIDLDEYNQLKFAASKLAESEKIIKESLKIKPEENTKAAEEEEPTNSNINQEVETKLNPFFYKKNNKTTIWQIIIYLMF